MLKILETRRDELQAQRSAIWDKIVEIKAQYGEMTDRQIHKTGLDALFERYEHVEAHLNLYSGAWSNGIMLSNNRERVLDWLREMPERVNLRPFIVAEDAALLDECAYAKKLLYTTYAP